MTAGGIEFLTGALAANPRRAGKQLRGDLTGIFAARRGTYRVLYRTNEVEREVAVLRIEHRRDAYRSRWAHPHPIRRQLSQWFGWCETHGLDPWTECSAATSSCGSAVSVTDG
ncbi:MAG: type II toxin-antitoxin system RelE/ParE family toxin [Actinomycetota bacterium]|nr:type II toxin-antitoxin system RelE/ParE family toxin [Actinomycetota bacterium]